jgi:hypothetical protein
MAQMFTNAPNVAVKRLLILLRAGYRVDYQSSLDGNDVISLRHPANPIRVAEPYALITYDGWLIGSIKDSDKDQLRIGPSDSEAFALFASRVPKPTWWELNAEKLMLPFAWAFFLVFGWGLSELLSWIWRVLSGNE